MLKDNRGKYFNDFQTLTSTYSQIILKSLRDHTRSTDEATSETPASSTTAVRQEAANEADGKVKPRRYDSAYSTQDSNSSSLMSNPLRDGVWTIGVSGAERVGNSIILPGLEGRPYSIDWCIFCARSVDSSTMPDHFQFKAVLKAAIDEDAFVKQCYKHLFNRDADIIGFTIYVDILRNHQLSRRELIKSLLSSEEAKTISSYAVVPAPSRWLSGDDLDAISSTPAAVLRVVNDL